MAKRAKYDAVATTDTDMGTIVQKLEFGGHKEVAILKAETAANDITHKEVSTNNNLSQQDWGWYYQSMNSNGMGSNQAGVNIEEPYERTVNEETVDGEEIYRD